MFLGPPPEIGECEEPSRAAARSQCWFHRGNGRDWSSSSYRRLAASVWRVRFFLLGKLRTATIPCASRILASGSQHEIYDLGWSLSPLDLCRRSPPAFARLLFNLHLQSTTENANVPRLLASFRPLIFIFVCSRHVFFFRVYFCLRSIRKMGPDTAAVGPSREC